MQLISLLLLQDFTSHNPSAGYYFFHNIFARTGTFLNHSSVMGLSNMFIYL